MCIGGPWIFASNGSKVWVMLNEAKEAVHQLLQKIEDSSAVKTVMSSETCHNGYRATTVAALGVWTRPWVATDRDLPSNEFSSSSNEGRQAAQDSRAQDTVRSSGRCPSATRRTWKRKTGCSSY